MELLLSESSEAVPLESEIELPPDPLSDGWADFLAEANPPEEAEAGTEPAPEPGDTPEPAKAAEPAEEAPESLSKNFALLAQKEKALRAREKELSGLQSRVKELEELEAAAKDPWALMDKLNLNFEELAREYVEQGKGSSPKDLQARQMQELQDQMRQQLGVVQQREREAAIQREHITIRDVVTADQFPLVAEGDTVSLVWGAVQTHYNETGDVLSYVEAAEAVESALEELGMRLAQNPKIRARLTAADPEKESREVKKSPARTLRNGDGTQVTRKVEDDFDIENASDEDLIARLSNQLVYKD